MKGQLRIDTLFAFIVLDEDGTEGVPAVALPPGVMGPDVVMLPMMGADAARIAALRDIVMTDPRLVGKTITLAQFSTRSVLEVIQR